jgi:hypothetical protein
LLYEGWVIFCVVIEIWKEVLGFEGFYEVSNSGQVKSLPRNGTKKEPRILKQTLNKYGYYRVNLQKPRKDLTQNKNNLRSAHRLVAIAFIPNPEKKPQVNHKNGIKTDNEVKNLEWVTNLDNITHSINVLKNKHWRDSGATNHNAKKVNQYDLDGTFIKEWGCIKDAKNIADDGDIIKVCKHQKGRITAGGYKWEYA